MGFSWTSFLVQSKRGKGRELPYFSFVRSKPYKTDDSTSTSDQDAQFYYINFVSPKIFSKPIEICFFDSGIVIDMIDISKILPLRRILSRVLALRQLPMKSLDSRQSCDVIEHCLKVMTPDKIRRIGRIFDIFLRNVTNKQARNTS